MAPMVNALLDVTAHISYVHYRARQARH